jgi:membrane protease YdiL (CAAX protease family)
MRARVPPVVRQHPLLTYLLLAFGIAWAAVLWVVAPTGIPGSGAAYVQHGPLVFLAMLVGPSVGGLGLTAILGGGPSLRDLWTRQRHWRIGAWWAAVLITPVVLVLLGPLALWSPELILDLGWTGFALPHLLRRHGWLKAGLLLGIVWGLWHLLADYWGNADAWGSLYAPRYLLWCGAAFTAYRILIAWAYSHTRSLLLAQLMHAGFTGGQVLLAPATLPLASGLVWYGAFAAALWLIVGCVAVVEGIGRRASSTGLAYAPS